ncbi:hypothetical protein [Streptomyces roseochromogenus]|uniref:Uncharacterized protein n=1 Tax=Streptomyces roseochromogenus subsp. oscitans DS 12.976 TaxID=1352936 RepID=V6JXS2_STRRC|nr:hypothetical protein [Streptomyces roseochromogenus]EST24508.1 hypothetical protein M878_30545 [Streptomyces roseochromogenus subsp. oscitans DS 12.976]
MSTLSILAIAVGVLAVIGLGFGLPDRWFCALLALACLIGGADAAYRELTLWAFAFFASGAMFAGASVHAIYTARRERRRQ